MSRYIKRPKGWESDPLYDEDVGLLPEIIVPLGSECRLGTTNTFYLIENGIMWHASDPR